ncbi:cation-translocating P-type ATPase [Salinarimonas rosea]|uniref:cation-translocating P-type ATPase n=1 Tax=Salinarimonas rosea TaxID=552063 RepID=UPI0003F78624|nr:HAD-IC family P-type ATPase [Salinarimonas rosea]
MAHLDEKTRRGGPASPSHDHPTWHASPPEETLAALRTGQRGLSAAEARRRLEAHGPNILREEKTRPWWRRLLAQFENVLIIVLLIAGTVTLFLQQWIDAGAIFGVVVINAGIGFYQEGKAEKALDSIKRMLSPRTVVIRDGSRTVAGAEELVPGDIVALEAGDRVPADIRLLRASRLRTQEAALTGESEPVDKSTDPVEAQAAIADRTCMAFAGTLVAQGAGEGVVVATGRDSEIGRISEMLREVEQLETPLSRQLDRFAKILAAVIVAVAAAMALFGITVHGSSIREMFLAAVGLAVAAIPQGLPALVTITLAVGVQRMARRNAIIRRLPAVETLGTVSIVFSDKTGTLTRNEMTARRVVLADGEAEISGTGFAPEGRFRWTSGDAADDASSPGTDRELASVEADAPAILRDFLVAGALCNDAALEADEGHWSIVGDPTEGSLIVAAAKAGIDARQLRETVERVDEIPFDSDRKYMATLDRESGAEAGVVHVKGAPEVLLSLCDRVATSAGDTPFDRDEWERRIEALSADGMRVLAVARRSGEGVDRLSEETVEGGLALLGLVGMIDPPRESATDAVRKCLAAGIRVKMVTGDHALTARAVAAQLGLARTDLAMTGAEVEEASSGDLRAAVEDTDVFARASPESKLMLVRAVQEAGAVCAMTGDGVNDAPALKQADVGVAMGRQGTEAAKDAAEMVLADDNFATIAAAVEEGRTVYDNIRKAITFLLPTNGGEALSILGAVIVGVSLPITPVQILWVNMVTAVTLGLSLAFEPAESDVMARPPRDPDEPILSPFLIWRILFVSALLVTAVFGVYLLVRDMGGSVELARTAAVNMLVCGEAAYLFNTRFLVERSISRRGLVGSRPALIALAIVIAAQLAWTYAPPVQLLFQSTALSASTWGLIAGITVLLFLVVEAEKLVWRRRARPGSA